jgi:hypothetical protein
VQGVLTHLYLFPALLTPDIYVGSDALIVFKDPFICVKLLCAHGTGQES